MRAILRIQNKGLFRPKSRLGRFLALKSSLHLKLERLFRFCGGLLGDRDFKEERGAYARLNLTFVPCSFLTNFNRACRILLLVYALTIDGIETYIATFEELITDFA